MDCPWAAGRIRLGRRHPAIGTRFLPFVNGHSYFAGNLDVTCRRGHIDVSRADFAAQGKPTWRTIDPSVLAKMLPVTLIGPQAWRRTGVLGVPELLIRVARAVAWARHRVEKHFRQSNGRIRH